MKKFLAKVSSSAGKFFTRGSYRRVFVERSLDRGPDTGKFRKEIVTRFARVHGGIECAHQEAEMLILVEAILTLAVSGPIVELGCFKGGSSAKLSIVAKAVGRKLYVCDSFEGLPAPEVHDTTHHMVSGRVKKYAKGDYLGRYDEVVGNVTRWGCVDSCEFVKGYFSKTLPNLCIQPALVFMDVDLIDSARDCVRHLWPRLQPGAKYFTHEAGAMTFVRGLLSPPWWHSNLGICPPALFGAAYGFGPHAANLAYFEKLGDASSEGPLHHPLFRL